MLTRRTYKARGYMHSGRLAKEDDAQAKPHDLHRKVVSVIPFVALSPEGGY